jgi:hypothetical protein
VLVKEIPWPEQVLTITASHNLRAPRGSGDRRSLVDAGPRIGDVRAETRSMRLLAEDGRVERSIAKWFEMRASRSM